MSTKRNFSEASKSAQLHETFTNRDQSWFYESLWSYAAPGREPYKLQVSIRRNAYDHQSHAHIRIWNNIERKWNGLASIPYPAMESVINKRVSYVSPAFLPPFKTDEAELLRLASLILD